MSARLWLGRVVPHVARVAMGLIFALVGLNGFLFFLPVPKTPIPAAALAFMGALASTGYMLPLLASVQLLVGVLLVVNRFVPLALALIAPVIVNITAYHLFLRAPGAGRAALVVALEVYLAWTYPDAFRPMLALRAVPRMNPTLNPSR